MIRRSCHFFIRRPISTLSALLLGGLLLPAGAVHADLRKPFDKVPPAVKKKAPDSVEDLKAIEEHVATLVDRVMPAVVCVRVGASFGSGVIVTKDGHVLTAGHVSGDPNRDVVVYFHDGKKVKGKTLGGNHGIDSGMIKIVDEGNWPYVEMGNSSELKTDQWCMVCSHPGGFKIGRTPPVRLGRIKSITSSTLTTECALVGGDSGGPLFDMHGRVIGINSRIGQSITANMHVTVNPFKDSWDKLAQGEVFGGKLGGIGGGQPTKGSPYIGVTFDRNAAMCIVLEVAADSPAAKAGLKADDVILKADGKDLTSGSALATVVGQKSPGNKITVIVQRGQEMLTLTVEIGKRP
jgi:serine protease Do